MTSFQLRLKTKDILEVSLFIDVTVPRIILVLVGLGLVREVLCGTLNGDTFTVIITGSVVAASLLLFPLFRARAADRALRFLFNSILPESDLLLAFLSSLILPLFLQLLEPCPSVSWQTVLEGTQIMDVPHGVLSKLADVDTINETNELDVVIV
jgi:hypothetical protein